METQSRKSKRCKHGMVEGTCALCAGYRHSENPVDPFAVQFAARPVFIRRLNVYPFNSHLDEEVVSESACSLL